MTQPTQAKRIMIYLGESDSWRGRSLYLSILETLRKSGIAGATVTRAIAGFGAHSRIRTNTTEILSMDLPIVISIVETPENANQVLALVGPMVREGLITVEDVEIVKYTHRYLQPLPADRPVSEVMTRDVTTVAQDAPARQIAELLMGKLFKAVPVVDENRHVVGMITDGDLLRNAGMPARLGIGERLREDDLQEFLAQIRSDQTARQIMTSPVVTADEEESLGHVVNRLLEHKLKRMPVINQEGTLVGLISRLDILRAVAGQAPAAQEHAPSPHPGQTIGELMSAQVPIVHIHDDLADVLHLIIQAEVKRIIVLNEQEKPVGIITDGDLVERVSAPLRHNIVQTFISRVMGDDIRPGQATALDLMSQNVLSAPKETTLVEAINLMLHAGRKRLVVVDDEGHCIGIVDRQTLLAASLGTSMT
jgi:CBS domain-containing protein